LVEALPYIKEYFGKTIVIKYGGHAMIDDELKKNVILDLILMKYVGMNPVLVHGGGPEINQMLDRLGMTSNFIGGLRVTDRAAMEIVEMVLAGKINKEIVALIHRHGGKAVGLSGKDGNLITARQRAPELGFVGDVARINPAIIHQLTQESYIPVVAPIGVGEDGASYNINADHVAGELAGALKADKLIMLTDICGIMREAGKPETLISTLTISEAQQLIAAKVINKGMIPKVEACIRALQKGVHRTHIIDGRILHSILLEIFTDKGIGTMVVE